MKKFYVCKNPLKRKNSLKRKNYEFEVGDLIEVSSINTYYKFKDMNNRQYIMPSDVAKNHFESLKTKRKRIIKNLI